MARYATLDRRAFLSQVGSVALVAALLSTGDGEAAAGNRPRIGIQLYTLQAELMHDFAGTLKTLRQIGYRQVERDQAPHPIETARRSYSALRKAALTS